jgi:hypothetical protein
VRGECGPNVFGAARNTSDKRRPQHNREIKQSIEDNTRTSQSTKTRGIVGLKGSSDRKIEYFATATPLRYANALEDTLSTI